MIGAKETTAATKVLPTGRRVRHSLWGKFTKLPKHWTNVIQLMERLPFAWKNQLFRCELKWYVRFILAKYFSGKNDTFLCITFFPISTGNSENFRTTCQQLDFRLPAATVPGEKRLMHLKIRVDSSDKLDLWCRLSMALTDFSFRRYCHWYSCNTKEYAGRFCSKIPGFDSNFLSVQMWILQPEELKTYFHGILASFYNAEICSCINGNPKIMMQFWYLGLYHYTETIYCCLSLNMARMEMDWNLKKLASFFSTGKGPAGQKNQDPPPPPRSRSGSATDYIAFTNFQHTKLYSFQNRMQPLVYS